MANCNNHSRVCHTHTTVKAGSKKVDTFKEKDLINALDVISAYNALELRDLRMLKEGRLYKIIPDKLEELELVGVNNITWLEVYEDMAELWEEV